ncbi:hypothetical protein SETIT_7G042400v2 [Setaria italica]|uniref:Calponin-homology (CH) domain-containing protein n=1 Tax=Setaria italica TaxID=4555 RepID=A0A368RS24_SETIT|nr:hypothetical protein SETIT_7G042400v2 [Setaria italica]
MEPAAWESSLPEWPSEEEFCAALRNGLVLCKVLNRVNPGAVPKVMENPVITVQTFEDMRNFLVAVSAMNLLTFETSDIETGYHEWKLSDGIGIWWCGGIVKIASTSKRPVSHLTRDGGSDQQMLEFVHLLSEVCLEESRVEEAQHSLFHRFVL